MCVRARPLAARAIRRVDGRGGLRRRRDRRAAPSGISRDRGPRRLRGAVLPQRALGPRRRDRREARRRRRHRIERDPDRGRGRRPGRRAPALPADAAVGRADGEPRLHRRGEGGVPAEPGGDAEVREAVARALTDGFANVLFDATSPELQGIQRHVRREPRAKRARPVLRERLRPSYRAACKRLIMSGRLLRGDPASERRARDRAHRARRARAACGRATACCTSSTCWSSRPGSASTLRPPDARHRRRGVMLDESGPTGRSRTCRSRSRASRTSSC